MRAEVCLRSAAYRGESVGRRSDEGVGDLERESWKSSGGLEEDVLVMVDGGGVGVTTSSRH